MVLWEASPACSGEVEGRAGGVEEVLDMKIVKSERELLDRRRIKACRAGVS